MGPDDQVEKDPVQQSLEKVLSNPSETLVPAVPSDDVTLCGIAWKTADTDETIIIEYYPVKDMPGLVSPGGASLYSVRERLESNYIVEQASKEIHYSDVLSCVNSGLDYTGSITSKVPSEKTEKNSSSGPLKKSEDIKEQIATCDEKATGTRSGCIIRG